MRGRAMFYLLVVLLLWGTLLWAQLPTASLNGTVTDPQGALVTGAKITLTNTATGETREQTTSSDGRYNFVSLPAGGYSLGVSAAGFAKAEAKSVTLEVGHASTLDVPLSVARAGEVVTVTAENQVELTQSEVQGQISAATVQNLPLNGRNFLELAFLLPGNRPATNYDPTKTQTLEVSSAGGFGRGGNISVDGADNNDEVVGGTLANFPQNSIQEFQIATNRYTAEVGRSATSIINIITKSGTNTWHGDGFGYLRSKVLQAKPALLTTKPPFTREQFGGSVGGPFIQDKFFGFVSAEYRNQNHAVPVSFRNFATDTVDPTFAPAFYHDFLINSRADYNVTNNDKVFVRYAFERELDIDNGSLRQPAGSAANRQTSFNRYNSLVAAWNRIFSSTQINNLTMHVDTFLTKIPAFSPNDPATNPSGLAAGNEIRFPSLQDGANFRIPQQTPLNRFQLRDTYSWVRGKHTLRMGGEWQNSGAGVVFDLFGSGTIFTTEDFASENRHTGTPCSAATPCDDTDIPIAVALNSAAPKRPPTAPTSRNTYMGLFVQDDWKAAHNLTLNLGLRWEVDFNILAETNQNRSCPDPTDASNANCEYIRNVIGPHDSSAKYKNFAPRFGFAWDPLSRGRTVVRGGYGIYYDRVVLEAPILEVLLNGRILPLGAFGGSNCSNEPKGDCSLPGAIFDAGTPTLANPFVGTPAVFGVGVNVMDNHAATPYVQQFTFGVQQQVAQNFTVSADAIHNFGSRFLIGRFLRQLPKGADPNFLSCPNSIDPCTIIDPASGKNVSACFTKASDPTCDQVTNIESSAKTWYDALLVSIAKRPTGSQNWKWGFNINYTLSKTFNFSNDDQIPFNGAEDTVNTIFHVNNLRLEKGFAPTDERHRFVFYGQFSAPWQIKIVPSWIWASHVPMDCRVASLSARLPNIARNACGEQIPDGAALNSAITAYNALPPCTGAVGGPVPCNSTTVPLVDPGLEFGDDYNTFSLRLSKTISLTERQSLELIGEGFNIANTANIRGFVNTNFSGFNNDITSSNFNQPVQTADKFFGPGGARAFQFGLVYRF